MPHLVWGIECALLLAGWAVIRERALLPWTVGLLVIATLAEWALPVPGSLLMVGLGLQALYFGTALSAWWHVGDGAYGAAPA